MPRASMSKAPLTNPLISAALVALTVLAVWQPGKPAAAAADAQPAEPAKAVVSRACQSCHDLSQVTEARHTPQQWGAVIQRMRTNGADLTDAEAKQIQDYLARTYPKGG